MILIVDDDRAVLHSLELLLKQAGFASIGAADPRAALQHLDRSDLELVLQDMNFSRQTTGEEGLELLDTIKARRPEVPVILITAWGSIELAVRGMRGGAADFVTKPWRNEQVVQSVRTALNLVASGARDARPQRADGQQINSGLPEMEGHKDRPGWGSICNPRFGYYLASAG